MEDVLGKSAIPFTYIHGDVNAAEEAEVDGYPDWSKVVPIVYHPEYNIKFFGLQKLHPFDSCKYQRAFGYLLKDKAFENRTFLKPKRKVTDLELLHVHTERYLQSLYNSGTVARITEVPFVYCLPSSLVRRCVLSPMQWAVSGTLLAAEMALKHPEKWAINLGGGFHHASSDRGEGFCVYADISLAVYHIRERGLASRVMIIDLDAHQGNGHERDLLLGKMGKLSRHNVFIYDAYNGQIYPGDVEAKRGIDVDVSLKSRTSDVGYLSSTVSLSLTTALNHFQPNLVLYNAGTDILTHDPLGALSVSRDGVLERDRRVIEEVIKVRGIPLVMLLSGGYQKCNAEVIADSISAFVRSEELLDIEEEISVKNDDNSSEDCDSDVIAVEVVEGEREGEEESEVEVEVEGERESADVQGGGESDGGESSEEEIDVEQGKRDVFNSQYL